MKLILLLFFVFPVITFSQSDWRTLMDSPDATFQEIRDAYYARYGDSIGVKGSGWKQFKRWEYFQSLRLDENGNMQTADQQWLAVQQHEQKKLDKNYSTGSGNWQEVGPVQLPTNGTSQPNGLGRISAIAFHPTDNQIIYVGAASGGFWKSTDKGATWSKSVNGLTRLGVSSIVVDPNNTNTIFIGTGDRDGGDVNGYGVWKSTDGGATWSPSNTGMGNITVGEVLIHPNNSNILLAAGYFRVYRSTDGGAHWTMSSNSLGMSVKELAFHPTNPNIVYAAGNKIYKSTDNGVSFTRVAATEGLPSSGVSRFALAVSSNQPNWVYALAGNDNGLVGVYRSTDSGVSFTSRSTTPNILGWEYNGSDVGSQAKYDLVIVADPTNANIIYTGGINTWKSTNGGNSLTISAHWSGQNSNPEVHADQHVLEFSPHNTSELYNGNDGGVYVTSDGGTSWQDISSGLAISQIYKIGVAQSQSGLVIAGFQDNGTGIVSNQSWRTEIGGDGMECTVDPTDTSYMYGALYYGDIRRSSNGGNSFGIISSAVTEQGPWVTPYKLDPNNPNIMYAAYDNVWRNTDVKNTNNWTKISGLPTEAFYERMVDLAIAPSNSDVLYVSKNKNTKRFYKTTNASAASPTWTNLSGNLPINITPKDIEIDPTDENHLFIALDDRIYESIDGGSTWTDYSGTLPFISLNTIVIDQDSPVKAIYVGMDVGIYYRDNTMSDWTLYDSGIPNVRVTELEIYQNSTDCKSKIYAATYGQGVWVSDLKDPGSIAPKVCFKTSETKVCAGSSVKFTDLSDFSPVSWSWSITPNTFSFTNSTTATSQNPEVIFNAAGTYNVTLTATNANGSDTKSETGYISAEAVENASEFNENFESYGVCATTSNCGATNCAITGKWKNLSNGSEDDIDWRIDSGGTVSNGTGPSQDFSPGTPSGKYAYLEASGCYNKTAILESSCIYLNGHYTLNLGYHMYSNPTSSGTTGYGPAGMGSLNVDIFSEGQWNEGISSISDPQGQGNQWKILEVPLTNYAGKYVKLRIRGVTGPNFKSDMAIDSMSFKLNAALPAELISFEAKLQNNEKTLLDWSTASERNVDYFEIQRSTDANNWQKLTKVNAAGNSIEKLDYKTTDDNPSIGINYYRLKIVDLDGEYEYSPIRSVFKLAPNNKISIYPNPANSSIQVINQDIDEKRVLVQNSLGQHILVHTNPISSNQISVEIEHLTNGIYYLVIISSDGEKITKKFVKK